MEKIKLEIIGMSYSQAQSGAYALILEEQFGNRRLPIIIGGFEAQSIAIELEKIKTPRPLTHDLFKTFADAFKIEVVEIIINKFSDGVFYAQLICTNGVEIKEVDSRTSDAIAIALRFGCPISTYESIMTAAGIQLEDDGDFIDKKETSDKPKEDEAGSFTEVSTAELKELLQNAIENEEYEKASQIRDELNKRK